MFQFSTDVWFVTQKFNTKSSCLTYEFKTDEMGLQSIEQVIKILLMSVECSPTGWPAAIQSEGGWTGSSIHVS